MKYGAPEEIRTPDPQIRSLMPGQPDQRRCDRAVRGSVVFAALLLAACVPAQIQSHDDCTDGETWRDNCDRDRAAVERPEPEPGGHWATRGNEPDSRRDPDAHRDWQRDRDQQREEGTW